MATRKKGQNDFTGRCGDVTFYLRKGKLIMRPSSNKKSSKPRTARQLSGQRKMALLTDITKRIADFIKVGYALKTADQASTALNEAITVNRKGNVVIGIDPDLEVDFSRLQLSEGSIPVNEAMSLKVTPTGIAVSWDSKTLYEGMKGSDRLMLCAYAPEKKVASTELDGARRKDGQFEMSLAPYGNAYLYHVYATFIAWDRTAISNSMYLGAVAFVRTDP